MVEGKPGAGVGGSAVAQDGKADPDPPDAPPPRSSGTYPAAPLPHEHLAPILKLAHDAIIAVDRKGIILFFNQGAEQIFGWRSDEVLGEALDQLLPADAVQGHGEHLRRFAEGPARSRLISERTMPIRGRRRDGTEFPARATITKMDTPDGPLLAVILSDRSADERAARAVRGRRRAEEEAARVGQALASSLSATTMSDLDGRIAYANQAFLDLWGYRTADELLGRNAIEFCADRKEARRIAAAVASRGSWIGDMGARAATGRVFQVHLTATLVRDPDGQPTGMIASFIDVTERQAFLDALVASERFTSAVLDSMRAQTAVLDASGSIMATNRAWRQRAESTGASEMLGLGASYLEVAERARGPHSEGALEAGAGIRAVLAGEREVFEMDYPCATPEGVRWFKLVAEPFDVVDGGAVVSHHEVTARKQAEEALAHHALHDALTGLPNRTLLDDRIAHALSTRARRESGIGLLFLDLDRFKVVNDSLGHAAGDEILEAAAHRVLSATRRADTVARFGGDEFVVLCEDLSGPEEAERVARRIVDAFADPFLVRGRRLYVHASVGIALETGEGHTADTLIRNADTAMYYAKQKGRGRYAFFDDHLRDAAVQRLELEHHLRDAVERRELHVVYQPQIRTEDGQMVGVEALLRWTHPERGPIGPDVFIPIAEETGLIVRMGTWVLQEACRQLATWRKQGVGPRRVAVNFSARQLAQPDVVRVVTDALTHSGVPAECLTVEITESVLMGDGDVAEKLIALQALGVRIAIDDFGTGYASLSYLRRFPVDVLKIDRSFVASLTCPSDGDLAIVRGILALAEALDLQAIAEGVETPEQLATLRELGCRCAQGYLFDAPLMASDVRHR
ncbi:MAG: EAL and GGDEF domain-containing protein [Myxococcota bacterium]